MKNSGRRSYLAAATAVVVVALLVLFWRDDKPMLPATAESAPTLPNRPVVSSWPDEMAVEPDGDYTRIADEERLNFDCSESRTLPYAERSDEETEREIERSIEVLLASNDPELAFAAALLTRDSIVRRERLARAAVLNPNSAQLVWNQLISCERKTCDNQSLLDHAAAIDGDNGAVWLERAGKSLRREDWASAEKELRRGLAAPRFDTYFIDHVVLLESALAASSNLGYSERVDVSMGFAAAMAIPGYGDLTKACKNEGNNSATWISLCDDLGRAMSTNGTTAMDDAIGHALRRLSAERRGDDKAAERHAREARASFSGPTQAMTAAGAYALLENDEGFLARYIERFAANGELAAYKYAADEAERLREDPTYNQCNFVRRSAEHP